MLRISTNNTIGNLTICYLIITLFQKKKKNKVKKRKKIIAIFKTIL